MGIDHEKSIRILNLIYSALLFLDVTIHIRLSGSDHIEACV
jgi:hypothetical protein